MDMIPALPSRREEAWRWSHLERLSDIAGSPRSAPAPIDAYFLGLGGARLVFVDGIFDAGRSTPGPVSVTQLDLATDHPLGRQATNQGWQISVDAGLSLGAIEIVHVATGGANHLGARITLGVKSQANLIETFVGQGWSNRLTQVSLAPDATLARAIRVIQASGFVSLRDEALIGDAASLTSVVLGAGGMDCRIDGTITCTGVAAVAEIGGALLAQGEQHQECAVAVHHDSLRGKSQQIWRAVAKDRSSASLAARVEVARDAQKTDGEQSLRGLVLNRSATINLKPELEIFADDVKCAHGATVGELDKSALFYLMSRGIEPARAKALLTRAFVADALERISDETVRTAFAGDAEQWLEAAL